MDPSETNSESDSSDKVPETDMPSKHTWFWDIPFLLGFDRE